MKVRVERDELATAIEWLKGFLGGNVHIAALNGIHLTAADGHLTLRATDLDLAGEATIPAAIDEPGMVLPTGGLLHAVVSRLPDAGVEISEESNVIDIRAGRVDARVPLLEVHDFPATPDVGDERTFVIPSSLLESIAKRVAPAAHKGTDQPAYTAVHLIVAEGKLTAAATDKYRLHRLVVDLDTDVEADVLLPPGLFAALTRLDMPVAVSVSDDLVSFSTDERQVISNLVAGKQPEPAQFFARTSEDAIVSVDRGALSASLARCMALTSRGEKNLAVELSASDGALHLASADGVGGSITDSVEATGEGLTAVSPSFLSAAIDALGGERVELALSDRRPIGVRSPDGGAFDAVVMPVLRANTKGA